MESNTFSPLPREKCRVRMKKTKDILRLRNCFKFPSVKVIVKEIAYKSLEAPKKAVFSGFLRTDNQNLVPKFFFKDFQYVIWM